VRGDLKNMLQYNKSLKLYSRKLRRNMTDAERLLWSKIKGKQLNGYQFYRQKVIGNYIVDFYSSKANLIIELDGGQHYSDEGKKHDKLRDKYMANIGMKVLRFSDRDVLKNLEAVMGKIWSYL
jgi:very-short-patch-repair endonuclease